MYIVMSGVLAINPLACQDKATSVLVAKIGLQDQLLSCRHHYRSGFAVLEGLRTHCVLATSVFVSHLFVG